MEGEELKELVRGWGLYLIISKVAERAERLSYELALRIRGSGKILLIECCYELSRYLIKERDVEGVHIIEVRDYYTNFLLINLLEKFLQSNGVRVIVISSIQKNYLKSLSLITNALGARIALAEMLAYLDVLSVVRNIYSLVPITFTDGEEINTLAKYARAVIDADKIFGDRNVNVS